MSDSSEWKTGQPIEPRRAPVVPRVCALQDTEALPLQHHVERLLNRRSVVPINLYGPAGSGKTTALAHLAALFPKQLILLDDVPWTKAMALDRTHPIIVTSKLRCAEAVVAFELQSWTDDDFIEYLLARHREKCKSVMARLSAVWDRSQLGGLPELWAVVLDALAADEALPDVLTGIRRHLENLLGSEFESVRGYIFEKWMGMGSPSVPIGPPPAAMPVKLVRHEVVGSMMLAEGLAAEIRKGKFDGLARVVPAGVIAQAGRLLAASLTVLQGLSEKLTGHVELQPSAVGVLLAANRAWRPAGDRLSNLAAVRASGASWKGLDLTDCDLMVANLFGADLTEANLYSADATGANMSRAKLSRAFLEAFCGKQCNLSHADLSHVEAHKAEFFEARLVSADLTHAHLEEANLDYADLTNARLMGASLESAKLKLVKVEGANFSGANLKSARFLGVDFRAAILNGADFTGAKLLKCDFETLELAGANFRGARLSGSYLTASVMPGAIFRGASLRKCGLAEVDWENADLREVDFKGATFHMGSSRSGLVKSDIASEGSRTGFYTDDYDDKDYKPPEEIRKANLCGCDLRGAKVFDTDFYLVDLRGARYSPEQGRHFAKCGAILKNRD
jgi:uncharacterized protein YjbI with pentapeptide repeats